MPTFTKDERLCSKLLIAELVEKGRSFNVASFRISWMKAEQIPAPVQVMISIPKRNFKRAVDRNRLKRLARESYRNQKQSLYTHLGEKNILLLLVYTGKEIIGQQEMNEKINAGLVRLMSETERK